MKHSDEIIHKVSFTLDTVQSKRSDGPNVELTDTKDELSVRVEVRTTLPSGCKPIKTMCGMGIEGNGKDDLMIN